MKSRNSTLGNEDILAFSFWFGTVRLEVVREGNRHATLLCSSAPLVGARLPAASGARAMGTMVSSARAHRNFREHGNPLRLSTSFFHWFFIHSAPDLHTLWPFLLAHENGRRALCVNEGRQISTETPPFRY
jgi:hypothetical protein